MDRSASAATQPNLEEVIDRITDAIFALDNEWRFTFVTPQGERLLQSSAADLLGRVVWDVLAEAVGTQFQIQLERAVRDQVAVGFREYYQPFETWFDVRAYPSPTGLSVFLADVSDTVRVEKQLHETLAERTELAAALDDERVVLHTLMANTDAHLAYLDPEFRFIAVNETYAAGSGHAAHELIGRNHFEVFPSEENLRIFERARDEREAVVFRAKPFEFPDQPWRGVTYWDWRLTPVFDSGGAVKGLVLSLVNVTESVKRRRFSEALNHLNEVIHSTLDFDRIVSEVVDPLAKAMGSEIAGVALRTGDSSWRIVDVYGLSESVGSGALFDESVFPSEPSSRPATAPFVSGEAAGQPFTHGLLAELGVRSLLVAPLAAPIAESGVIAFGYRSGPGTFDEIQIDFAAKVAASLSLALNNSRLFEAESRAARMAASLASINEVLLSTLAIEDIIDRVVLETCRAVGADMSFMAEVVGQDMVVSHVMGFAKELVGQKVPLEELPAIREAMETREPQLVSDTDVDPRASKEFGRELGYRAFMALPLGAGDKTNAVLSYTYSRPRDFDEHDREFAMRLSVALSLALENARHFQAERTIADRLQEALLAIPDSIEGVEFAHAYYSATEAARVGGDFYDIFELNHSHVGITIGDVAGKGLDAAVLTSLVKNTIRAHATEKGKTPSDVLALTNDLLFKATGLDTFVTVFFGILDCRDGRLVYSNGGHTTAVLVAEEGTTVRLPVTGPILGAFDETVFDQAEVRLECGELLFLYTDGLTEARRGDALYGEQRLFDLLEAGKEGSPRIAVQRVIDDVVEWTGGHLRDDLALLSLSRAEYPATTPTQQKLEL